jgi:hypothetical protein
VLAGENLEVRLFQIQFFQDGVLPFGMDDFTVVPSVDSRSGRSPLLRRVQFGGDSGLVQEETYNVEVQVEKPFGTGLKDAEKLILVIVEIG